MKYRIMNHEENGEHVEIGHLESAKNRHTLTMHGDSLPKTYGSLADAMAQARKNWPRAYIEKAG